MKIKLYTVYLGTQGKKSNVITLYRFIYIFYKQRENAADITAPFQKPTLPAIRPAGTEEISESFSWMLGHRLPQPAITSQMLQIETLRKTLFWWKRRSHYCIFLIATRKPNEKGSVQVWKVWESASPHRNNHFSTMKLQKLIRKSMLKALIGDRQISAIFRSLKFKKNNFQ